MRNELLNETIFYNLDHARSTLARWTAAYNQKRPRSALGYLTPAEFAGAFTATGAPAPNSTRDSSPNWMNVGGHSIGIAPRWPFGAKARARTAPGNSPGSGKRALVFLPPYADYQFIFSSKPSARYPDRA
jgi:hypothetical protein